MDPEWVASIKARAAAARASRPHVRPSWRSILRQSIAQFPAFEALLVEADVLEDYLDAKVEETAEAMLDMIEAGTDPAAAQEIAVYQLLVSDLVDREGD